MSNQSQSTGSSRVASWVAVVSVGLFLVVAGNVEPGPIGIDADVLRETEAMRTGSLTDFMVWATNLGGSIGTTLTVVLVTALLLGARRIREAAFFAVANTGALVLIRSLKAFFARPRPPADLVMAITTPTSPSFPSGHALSAMVLCSSMVLAAGAAGYPRVARALVWVAVVVVPLMGISRVYLGVHYPSDVLAGWALGFGWVWLVYVGYRATLTKGVADA